MAEDAARSSLFGSAATRVGSKPNPYLQSSGPADASAAAGNPFGAQPPAPPTAANSEDAARDSLLAGGKKRESALAFSAPEEPSQPALEPLDDGAVDFDFEGLNLMETAGYGSTADIVGRRTSSHLGGGRGGLEGGGTSALSSLAALEAELSAADSSGGGDGAGGGSGITGGLDLDLESFMSPGEGGNEVIREALSRGVDLRLYSKQVDAELRAMELLSIRDYVSQADAVAALFEQIEHCEGVLQGMQGMLSGFQDNLGGISREIRTLQEQSLSLSVQMSNRKGLAKKIDTFLTKVSLPEQLILRIVEAPVDEGWMRGPLTELGEKLSYVQHQAAASSSSSSSSSAGGGEGSGSGNDEAALSSLRDLTVNPFSTPVGRESLPQLEKLRVTACAKLRNFLLKAMQELTRPNSNMAKTQEYQLLKYSAGMTFLSEYGGEAGREVRAFYVESVGRHYGEIFKRYWDDLTKPANIVPANAATATGSSSAAAAAGGVMTCVLAPGALKGDTLAEYNAQARLNAAVAADPSLQQLATALGTKVLVDPFDLKDRPAILPEADAAPVPSHVAQQEALPPTYGGRGRRLPFEAVWRTAIRHLMDVCGSEGSFCAQFFGSGFTSSHNHAKEVLALVMAKPLNVLMAGLEEHLISTGDAPGLLLLVALNAAHRGIFSSSSASAGEAGGRRGNKGDGGREGREGTNVLSGFFDRINLLLWPRIKTALDAHIGSLKAIRETAVGSRRLLPPAASGPASAAGGAGGGGSSELGPHPLIKRYGELSCSFFLLHRQLSQRRLSDEMLPLHLNHLHREADLLLWQRLSGEVSSSRIAQLVLLASNYNYLLHLAKARGIGTGSGANNNSAGSSSSASSSSSAAASASSSSSSSSSSSAVDEELLRHWDSECSKANAAFCDFELELHFPQLYAFVVKKVEARMLEYAADNGIALLSSTSASSSASPYASSSNNATPGAPYCPQPTILQVPLGLPMPSSAIDGSEVQMVMQALNSGWKQGLRSLHEDVQRYFGTVQLPASGSTAGATTPLAAALTKKAMQSFLGLHERFTAILNRAFGGSSSGGSSSSNPLLKELLPAQVILQEMRARYAPSTTSTAATGASSSGMGVPM